MVDEWMIERPLKHLRGCIAAECRRCSTSSPPRAIKLGVFSDYPPEPKLEALGLGGPLLRRSLCSTDPGSARSSRTRAASCVACARWRLRPGGSADGRRPRRRRRGRRRRGRHAVRHRAGTRQTDTPGRLHVAVRHSKGCVVSSTMATDS